MTDQALVDLWLNGRAARTVSAYRYEAARFLRDNPDGLRSVDGLTANAWKANALGHLSSSAQHRAIAALGSLFNFALKTGYITQNPWACVSQVRPRETLHERILTPQEAARVIKAESDRQKQTAMLLLYYGGLRVSELCGLRCRDVLPREKGCLQVTVTGKGGKVRTVLLSPKITQRIKELLTQNPMAHVFIRAGYPFTPNWIWRQVKYAVKRAGIDRPISPHWFRHAHASHALENGADVKTIQTTLGHVSISTTGQYLHLRPNSSSSMNITFNEGETCE